MAYVRVDATNSTCRAPWSCSGAALQPQNTCTPLTNPRELCSVVIFHGEFNAAKLFRALFLRINAVIAIIRPPIQNTIPSESQNTPRNTLQIALQNQNTEKLRKIDEIIQFRAYFSYLSLFWFRRGIWGVLRGVFWGLEGFCILYGRRYACNARTISSTMALSQKRVLGHFVGFLGRTANHRCSFLLPWQGNAMIRH